MKELTLEAVQALLKAEDAPFTDNAEYFDCEVCGYCTTPSACVWSVACPVCGAGQATQCREGTRLVGLHKERYEEIAYA